MPLYLYKCLDCGKEQSRLVKVDDRDKQVCTCGTSDKQPTLERTVSAPMGFKFNGGGYYETDYKHK